MIQEPHEISTKNLTSSKWVPKSGRLKLEIGLLQVLLRVVEIVIPAEWAFIIGAAVGAM